MGLAALAGFLSMAVSLMLWRIPIVKPQPKTEGQSVRS
jgi:hypothetical protein